ncbi:MAG: Aldo/keto reductase [Lentinula lateritia]|nr:MAG: Aldo/keto reductase [Lentinula lateritia]
MGSRVPLIFGTMTIGFPGKNGVRTADLDECQNIMDVFLQHGHKELDTAGVYAEGTTEELLSKLDLKGATIDTKVYPVNPGDHSPAALRSIFLTSLEKLKRDRIRVLYLHAPDRSVPFEVTVAEVNKLYEEGRFEIFGLSNYAAWEVSVCTSVLGRKSFHFYQVAEIVGICKAKGYVVPKVYQVMYNAVTRAMEAELLPCARKFGLRLVIYNPLAGGLFAGKVTSLDDPNAAGGRFDAGGSAMGTMYRARYLKDGYFEALEHLKSIATEHNLRLTEIALRWCQHHSVLTPEDGVIIGASSVSQLQQNCEDSTKGPLPDAVVKALDEAHRIVVQSGTAPLYWR